MPAVRFTTITPNLVVPGNASSTAFYRDVLGFSVRDTGPPAAVAKDLPGMANPVSLREFALRDPDGHLIAFAERVARG